MFVSRKNLQRKNRRIVGIRYCASKNESKRHLSASFVLSQPRSNYYPPPPFPLSSPPPSRPVASGRGPSAPVAMETNHFFVYRKAPAQLRREKGGRNRLLILPASFTSRKANYAGVQVRTCKRTPAQSVYSFSQAPIPHPRQTQWASVGRGGGGEGEHTCCVVWRHGPLLPLPRKKGEEEDGAPCSAVAVGTPPLLSYLCCCLVATEEALTPGSLGHWLWVGTTTTTRREEKWGSSSSSSLFSRQKTFFDDAVLVQLTSLDQTLGSGLVGVEGVDSWC